MLGLGHVFLFICIVIWVFLSETWAFDKGATSPSLYRLALCRGRPSPISLDRDAGGLSKLFWAFSSLGFVGITSLLERFAFLYWELRISSPLWCLSAVLQVLWCYGKTLSSGLCSGVSRHPKYSSSVSSPREVRQRLVSWAALQKVRMLDTC